MLTLTMDLRTGLRSLRRAPVLAVAAILSLALGVGANTAVFSLVHAIVLQPMPVRDVDRLVGLFATDAKNSLPVIGPHLPMSWPNLEDVGRESAALSAVAAYTFPFGVALSRGSGEAEQAAVELVTGNYFEVLGVRAAMGRAFSASEDLRDGDAPVAVVSDRAFRRRFGSDATIVGQIVRINGHAFTIIGVGPRGFDGVNTFVAPDFWIPRGMHRQTLPSEFHGWLDLRRALFLNGVGRLRDSASPAQLEGELTGLAQTLAARYPRDNAGRGLAAVPLRETAILPGVRSMVVAGGALLMGIVSLVLLVACANVANIFLARAAHRRAEMALRGALGAGRRRLARLLLVESLIVAVAGGAAGLLIAKFGIDWLWSLRPPGLIGQNFVEISLNGPVLIYAIAATLGTAIVFGLAPAWSGSRADLATLLAEGGRGRGASRGSLRRAHLLVGAQTAASLVILAAAGMLMTSLRAAQHIDPGFDIDRLAVLQISPEQASFDRARSSALYRSVRERVAQLPPVSGVSWSQLIPLYGNGVSRTVQAWESGDDPARGIAATSNVVDERFFDVLGIPLVAGREFEAGDRHGSRAVVIVNDVLASRLWPDGNALGQQLRLFGTEMAHEVIGVARASRYTSLGESPQPAFFRPLAQEHVDTLALVVRSNTDPAQALALASSVLREIAPAVPVPFSGTMRAVAQRSLWATELAASVLFVLGLIAIGLAGLGVFGVAHYTSSQRQFELAIRMAVGASPVAAGRVAIAKTMRAVIAGALVGTLLAVPLITASRTLLYDVGWWPFVGVAIVGVGLVATALLASAWPARLATQADPSTLLR